MPELFVPRQSGQIIPPDRLPGGRQAPAAPSGTGGGLRISNTFNISGADDPTEVARRVVAEMKRQVQEFADGAYADYGMDLA